MSHTRGDSYEYEYLRMFSNSYMFFNALSPIQAGIVSKAFEIVQSPEGEQRRHSVQRNALAMRARFLSHGVTCYGKTSPIVPVPIGEESVARLVYRDLRQKNIAAMVIEFPIVAVGSSRLRIQLMATHTIEQVERGADIICESLTEMKAT